MRLDLKEGKPGFSYVGSLKGDVGVSGEGNYEEKVEKHYSKSHKVRSAKAYPNNLIA